MKRLLLLSLVGSAACILTFLNMADAREISQVSDSEMQNENEYDERNLGEFQTYFNEIVARAHSVPVGTIISWPVNENPEDMENWLECDGKPVPPKYEKLLNLMTHTPNLQGLFLRGLGGKSKGLNEIQEAAVGPHTHNIGGADRDSGEGRWAAGGAGYQGYDMYNGTRNYGTGMGDETRPINMAVRFLIRAQ